MDEMQTLARLLAAHLPAAALTETADLLTSLGESGDPEVSLCALAEAILEAKAAA